MHTIDSFLCRSINLLFSKFKESVITRLLRGCHYAPCTVNDSQPKFSGYLGNAVHVALYPEEKMFVAYAMIKHENIVVVYIVIKHRSF